MDNVYFISVLSVVIFVASWLIYTLADKLATTKLRLKEQIFLNDTLTSIIKKSGLIIIAEKEKDEK